MSTSPQQDRPSHQPSRQPSDEAREPDLLFVCSSGGHLSHFMTVRRWWKTYPRRWVTFNLPDARTRLDGEDVVWAHHPTTRHAGNLLRNFVLAFRVLRQRRPDVVISTGAAVAVPFFALARLMGIPTVFIEVIDRFDTPTLTGRLCKPLTTRFCVQTPEQLSIYPEAQVIGAML